MTPPYIGLVMILLRQMILPEEHERLSTLPLAYLPDFSEMLIYSLPCACLRDIISAEINFKG